MSNKIKILIIVEGERTETDFFHVITRKYGINADIYSVGTNLYSLYDCMKKENFECNVKDIVKELVNDTESKKILEQDFTYTYLVFDSDLQNKDIFQRKSGIEDSDTIAEYNFKKLKVMSEYFTDETDPSIGRLYINYPMMESYRYCDSFSDESYISAYVAINDMKKFKELASMKKLSGIPIQEYTKENFSDLIRLNFNKLVSMSDDKKPLNYEEYISESMSASIAQKQYNLFKTHNMLSVINTSLFLILDYYGNRDSFFDNIVPRSGNI